MLNFSRNTETKSFRRGLSLVGAIVLGLSMSFSSAYAQTATNTAEASASADVLKPITIGVTDNSSLDFGKFAPTGVAGTVTINARYGTRTSSGTFLFTDNPGGRLKLGVDGEPDRDFVMSIATSSVELTCQSGTCASTGGSTPMPITLFTAYPGEGDGLSPIGNMPTTHTLDEYGVIDVGIGGILSVAADQMPGVYSGDFNVTVTYQ